MASPTNPPRVPSPQEVDAAMTTGGGWSKRTLAAWGITWPPGEGWRKRLAREYAALQSERAAFLAGEGTLTVEQVRQWASELGLPYELDGCKDPTPRLMVAFVPAETGKSTVWRRDD